MDHESFVAAALGTALAALALVPLAGCAGIDPLRGAGPAASREAEAWTVVARAASGRFALAVGGDRRIAATTGTVIEFLAEGSGRAAPLPDRGEVIDLAVSRSATVVVHEDGSASLLDAALALRGELAADAAGGPFRRVMALAAPGDGFALGGEGGVVLVDPGGDGGGWFGPPLGPAPVRSLALRGDEIVATSGRRAFAVADGRFLAAASELAPIPAGSGLPGAVVFVRDPAGTAADAAIGCMDADLREVDVRRWTRVTDAVRLVRPGVLGGLVLVGDASSGAGDHRARPRRFTAEAGGLVECPVEPFVGRLRWWAADETGAVRLLADDRGLWRVDVDGRRRLASATPGPPRDATWDGRTLRVRTSSGDWAWRPDDPLPQAARGLAVGRGRSDRAALAGASVAIDAGVAVHRGADGAARTIDADRPATVVAVDGAAWIGDAAGVTVVDASGRVRGRVPVAGGVALLLPTPGGGGAAFVGPEGAMGLIARGGASGGG